MKGDDLAALVFEATIAFRHGPLVREIRLDDPPRLVPGNGTEGALSADGQNAGSRGNLHAEQGTGAFEEFPLPFARFWLTGVPAVYSGAVGVVLR